MEYQETKHLLLEFFLKVSTTKNILYVCQKYDFVNFVSLNSTSLFSSIIIPLIIHSILTHRIKNISNYSKT